MSGFFHELRHALRRMKRSPGFTAAVVLTLALSIGANTAIFSIVNALLLKNLPYAHPERMDMSMPGLRGRNPLMSEEM